MIPAYAWLEKNNAALPIERYSFFFFLSANKAPPL